MNFARFATLSGGKTNQLKQKKMETSKSVKIELISYVIDCLTDGVCNGVYGCDLHNELFNRDYYIIGYYNASQWLKKHDIDAFEAIKAVVDYENDNFGETSTEINSESIVNMYAYIVGEKILFESEVLRENWEYRLTDEEICLLIKEMENLLAVYKPSEL